MFGRCLIPLAWWVPSDAADVLNVGFHFLICFMIFIYVTVAKESVGKEEVTEEEVEGQEETEDGSEDEMEE